VLEQRIDAPQLGGVIVVRAFYSVCPDTVR
jgi:hypothetical protein